MGKVLLSHRKKVDVDSLGNPTRSDWLVGAAEIAAISAVWLHHVAARSASANTDRS